MAIKIIDEPDIYLTAAENERLLRDWERMCQYTLDPPSFESYVRSKKAQFELPKSVSEP